VSPRLPRKTNLATRAWWSGSSREVLASWYHVPVSACSDGLTGGATGISPMKGAAVKELQTFADALMAEAYDYPL
jgi:hypothetical protein